MTDLFTMPMLGQHSMPSGERVTWRPDDEDEKWAHRNHHQSLAELRDRCGLSWCELAAILRRQPYRQIDLAEARRAVHTILKTRAEQ